MAAKKAELYESLWKNGPNSHLIYYLSKHYRDDFMVSINNFMSYRIQHVVILQILIQCRGKKITKQGWIWLLRTRFLWFTSILYSLIFRSDPCVVSKIHDGSDENAQWVTTTGGNVQHLLYTVYGFNLNCVHFLNQWNKPFTLPLLFPKRCSSKISFSLQNCTNDLKSLHI